MATATQYVGQANIIEPPPSDGSVRERFEALSHELDNVGRGLSQLTAKLSSVLKPIGPEIVPVGRSVGGVEGPRRSPQCELACRIDAGVSVVRDLSTQVQALLTRLEI